MQRLLFLDTETGGLDPQKYSLLSIGVAVWDRREGIIFKKNLCPLTRNYIISPEAQAINHFSVDDYSREDFFTREEIADEFRKIKEEFFPDYKTLPLAGHNIQFDDSFLRVLFKDTACRYEDLFSYRLVDTYSVLQVLIHCGKIPASVSNSDRAFEYFGIKVNGRHTALGDAVATAELYDKLVSFIDRSSAFN